MTSYRDALRKIQSAVRPTIRRTGRATVERMEQRQLMAATSIKAVDSGGPDYSMVESNGHVVVLTSSASGAGANQIYRTDGGTSTSKKLLDATASGATLNSFADLVVTADGTVYFTANGGTGGGRQVFKLNVENGGFTQVTQSSGSYFEQLIAVGNTLYMSDGNKNQIVKLRSNGEVGLLASGDVTKMFRAKDQLFYVLSGDGGLFRSDGSVAGTYKISGALTVGSGDVFGTNDFLYFEGGDDNNRSLYRTDGSNAAPVKIADDFSLNDNRVAELDGAIYLSGGYYNTSPNAAGSQLYKITSATGVIEAVTTLVQTNGGAAPAGISAIGTNVYFVANDGEFVTSQGTYDRELWRYSTTADTTTKVTTTETLYPIEIGGGVLGSYYFVAAPTKDDARFGSRRLYRTTPENDAVEEVAGLPNFTSGAETKQEVTLLFAGSKGLFYSARNDDASSGGGGRDTDVYYVPTPYSYVDTLTNTLVVTATDGSDTMTMRVDDDELVMVLNGVEERRDLSTFSEILVTLKNGDDKFTADASVTNKMKINGDSGNDTIYGGSGNDNILGGGGKNKLYGMGGDDRLRGGNSADFLDGGDGSDRLYGWAGSDQLFGGNGIDYLYGDDTSGQQNGDTLSGGSGNDKLYGRGGDDLLIGGKQNDILWGGDGDDTLQGQDGNDQLYGEAGADVLYGHAGDDTFGDEADGSIDLIDGGADDDTLLGKDDEDEVALVEVVN